MGQIQSFFKDFCKIYYHSNSLMLSSSKLKLPQLRGFLSNENIPKRATSPAIHSKMRITFGCTKWGEFDHLCKKSQKKKKKGAKKPERKCYGTDNYHIGGINLYPVPLLQIFFKETQV